MLEKRTERYYLQQLCEKCILKQAQKPTASQITGSAWHACKIHVFQKRLSIALGNIESPLVKKYSNARSSNEQSLKDPVAAGGCESNATISGGLCELDGLRDDDDDAAAVVVKELRFHDLKSWPVVTLYSHLRPVVVQRRHWGLSSLHFTRRILVDVRHIHQLKKSWHVLASQTPVLGLCLADAAFCTG